MDRRQYQRVGLETPAKFAWRVPSASLDQQGQGMTRDISIGDVFVCTHDLPPIGSCVRLLVFFRSVLPRSRLILQTSAQVVRATGICGRGIAAGFAASFEAYTLRNDTEVLEQVGQLPPSLFTS